VRVSATIRGILDASGTGEGRFLRVFTGWHGYASVGRVEAEKERRQS
jgi:hypothetical protein